MSVKGLVYDEMVEVLRDGRGEPYYLDKRGHKTRLTPKQKLWAKEYIKNGGNGTKAALIAYPNILPTTAPVISSDNLRKANLQKYLIDLSIKAGIQPQDAMVFLNGEVRDKKSRLKALHLWFEVTGLKAPVKIDQRVEHNISEEDRKILESIAD